jgi:outer membrane protein TolC
VSTSLTLSPAVISGINQTKADYEAGKLSFEGAKQSLELQIRKIYYQILLLRSNKVIAAQNIKSAEERYDEAVRLAQYGQVPQLDTLQAQVDLENLKPLLRNAEMQYENALDSLSLCLGVSDRTRYEPLGNLEDALPLKNGTPQAENNDTLPPSLLANESLSTQSMEKSLESLVAQKKSLKFQTYSPSITFSWNANPSYTNSKWADSTGSFTIALTFNLDGLLPGSSARTQIEAVEDSITVMQSQIEEARRTQSSNIRQYLRAISQSIESIKAYMLNIELAGQTYEQYREAYQKGTASLSDVRSASDSLDKAQNNMAGEYYTLIAVSLDLQKELNIPFGSLEIE